MTVNLDIGTHLNEQQVLMLRLLKTPLPDKDFLEVSKLALKLLAKKLDEVVEVWEKETDVKSEDYEKLSNGHFRAKL